jgi:hypothetical protein
MAIQSAAITSGNIELFTAVRETAVTCIWICNTASYDPNNPTSGATTVKIYFVKDGDPIGPNNIVVNDLPVPAGETVTFDAEKMILDQDDRVVLSSASPFNLVATISTITV